MGLSIVFLAGIFGFVAAIFAMTTLGSGILGGLFAYSVVGTAVMLSWIISEVLETPHDHLRRYI